MMIMHCRFHEFGPRKPRIRIWSKEMESYGQFNVVSFDDVETLFECFNKIGIGQIIIHHCDSVDECRCKPLLASDSLQDHV